MTGLLEEKPSITNAIKDRLSPSSLKIQNVEKHIQKLKNDRDVMEIEKNNLHVIRLLTEKNYGHVGNIVRYVEDEEEMKNQVKENIKY